MNNNNAMPKTMEYDEAVHRLEEIVKSLENGAALSMDDYKKQASEAKKLLDFCQSQLVAMEKDLNAILPKE
jgi:exodeoxyribonuclease VII small subunit